MLRLRPSLPVSVLAPALVLAFACGGQEEAPRAQAVPPKPAASPSATPADLPAALMLSLSPFEVSPEGKPLAKPTAARLEILTREGGEWTVEAITDPESNVFHKAMPFEGGILTLAGSQAAIKIWRPAADGAGWTPETVWVKDFGGRFSRMRDAEIADLDGDGQLDLAVATHDQGVVAIVKRDPSGTWSVEEIDQEKDTFVHEIEVGDLDGDGRDELYVVVEAVTGGQVEIRRYEADTDPAGGVVIAELPDTQTRFLTAGDVDGDGKKEMVAAGMKSGLWLLRPSDAPATTPWTRSAIDPRSGGFEHASILADLDGDGRDELYVASDAQGEVRRYVFVDGRWPREVIHTRKPVGSAFTWGINPLPR